MNIVLAEEGGSSGQGSERSFDKALIRIGRDPFDSDIAFDGASYPMVSRKHAELRWDNGRWFLVDLGSSYGTFVNGNRINTPQQISVGYRLQFGESGPVFKVVWFEVAQDSVNSYAPPKAVVPDSFSDKPPIPAGIDPFMAKQPVQPPPIIQMPKPTPAQASPSAELEFVGTGRPRFRLSSNTIWIGRETACEIRFDPGDVMVSRKHASIRYEGGNFVLEDNKSFNGTLVNEQRISAPTPLYDGDRIELGIGGPLLRLLAPGRIAPQGADLAGQRAIAIGQLPGISEAAIPISNKTMVFTADSGADLLGSRESAEPQLLMSLAFGDKRDLTIGRDERSDIQLDGLQISNRHARLIQSGTEVIIEDLGSTNGVYVNGARIARQTIRPDDAVQIGTFLIRSDAAGNISVFDTRSKTRIDAVGLTKDVRNRFGGGKIRLLDGVSLSVQPNEFVGILGASGSGKSTLIDAMNGVRPANPGNVLINNLDLYRHFDSLKQSIGYVPQDDIIHRELSVNRTLYYVARLRLSRDVSKKEINQTISEVLDVTGLAERRNLRIEQLSGGQRKRVSMAVELITRPSVIFLDEPTSGLDPATAEKIMKLFRQIAESGRTVIMTTHAMENVKLFDKIVILMRGKLAFYGTPEEALKHLGASSYKDIYDRLEEPVARTPQQAEADRTQRIEQAAEDWKQKFLQTVHYRKYVHDPLKQLGTLEPAKRRKKRRLGIFGSVRQFFTLSRRYLEVLLQDKLNLFILFAQAPIIALLTFFVMGSTRPRDFVYFVLALVAIWFGTSVSAREIIRERPIYRRERMVNLGILPYLLSKLFILGIIVSIQCLVLFLPLKVFDLAGLMPMPGEWGGVPQFGAMLLTAAVGIALGLFVSALVRTSEMATSLVPLILIPQILFSGLVGVPSGINKAAGLAMPAAWSFDTIKRFSTLDTLEPEGAELNGRTGGLGLYKFTETENEKIITGARKSLEDYQRKAEDAFKKYDEQVRSGQNPPTPDPGEMPAIPAAKKIPADLSNYITFLHPWMNEILNQVVLMLMFGILVIATLIILRLQDIR
jgi:ABC-type multidrug transport system ATPase subunit/pSer/pThr/pTyr-binding forkhead associated (FHA) protein